MKKILQLFVLSFTMNVAHGATYYVATNGNDSNPGTLASPWRTLRASFNKLIAGDILYVRGGSYNEVVNMFGNSGTATSPITISAYGAELPIIDGLGNIPTGAWSNLLSINSNYVNMSGFEVRNTRLTYIPENESGGVVMTGHHCKLRKFNVHHCFGNGILIKGDYGIVEDSKVWQVNLENVNAQNVQGWGSALTAARDKVDGITDNAIIRRNIVYNCWGEALSVYESQGCIIEDNIVYDNWALNVYISDSRNTMFRRNIVYNTPNNAVLGVQKDMALADERSSVPRSSNNTIINNLFLNCNMSAFTWTIVPGSALTNALIANNTFVNSKLRTGTNGNSGNRIMNNIFTTSSSNDISSATGFTFSNNLWQGVRPTNAAGANDLVNTNPQLALTGPTTAGNLTSAYFKLLNTSPAIKKAIVLTEVTQDFFSNSRSTTPDMGGMNFRQCPQNR